MAIVGVDIFGPYETEAAARAACGSSSSSACNCEWTYTGGSWVLTDSTPGAICLEPEELSPTEGMVINDECANGRSCLYQWNGSSWVQITGPDPGCDCVEPVTPGTETGEYVHMACFTET